MKDSFEKDSFKKDILDMFKKRTGYICNVEKPETFNEKVQWRKFFDRNPVFVRMADKHEAKALAQEIMPEIAVNETTWIGTSAGDMKLRVPCVVKATAASGRSLCVRDEREARNPEVRTRARKWLGLKYGEEKGEWAYSQVKQRIMVERMETRPFVDLKYWIFDGVMKACMFMQYQGGKIKGQTTFDEEFKRVEVVNWPYAAPNVEFPLDEEERERGKGIAEKLAMGLDFVRVDLYYVFERAEFVFGEYTLYPTSGMGDYRPKEWDRKMGECWRLPCNIKK